MSEQNESVFPTGWAIVEVFGHRRLGGHIQQAGEMLRIDIPRTRLSEDRTHYQPTGEWAATQFYGQKALFCVTPVSADAACAVAASAADVQPVHRWELPARTETQRDAAGSADDHRDVGEDDCTCDSGSSLDCLVYCCLVHCPF